MASVRAHTFAHALSLSLPPSRALFLSLAIHIYICACVCTHTQREREVQTTSKKLESADDQQEHSQRSPCCSLLWCSDHAYWHMHAQSLLQRGQLSLCSAPAPPLTLPILFSYTSPLSQCLHSPVQARCMLSAVGAILVRPSPGQQLGCAVQHVGAVCAGGGQV